MRSKESKTMVILLAVLIVLLAGIGVLAIKWFKEQPGKLEVTYENYKTTARNLDDAAKVIVEHIFEETEAKTDYDKYLAIHDWLCYNVEYDYGGINSKDPEVHDPRLVIYFGRGVCDGYSYAYQELCNAAGLECKVLLGMARYTDGDSGHAWNAVKIDGKWYQVDVTWDDTTDESYYNYDINYNYWLRGWESLKEEGRTIDGAKPNLELYDYE